jgi:hypothetical protein
MPFKPALIFKQKTLIRLDIRDKIRVICSGKIISGYSILRVQWERICATVQEVLCFHWLYSGISEMQQQYFALQESCYQDKMLMKGLVADKSERFSISIKNTLHAANETRMQ